MEKGSPFRIGEKWATIGDENAHDILGSFYLYIAIFEDK
jgi:hypothetical protein